MLVNALIPRNYRYDLNMQLLVYGGNLIAFIPTMFVNKSYILANTVLCYINVV